ncbi:chemotaxis response regulator protein-glutamate methylesterase [Pantoea sp. Acro-805]|uniref:Protein-glutamate methylesterase/protein-glutamine glutaminase n=1 Tax=Candidatus Pantoea formicae TaxID=2608355 RepID=A0ABX0QW12_9GAMM|nr:chemotaxis response regulator protein-glutamate methylesterase [Pantoea formicae]MDF7647172.1 chemotaxis response regulator protein-glutamate methylesterase [Erwiniaceae bacterium L1_54_3]NIF01213.1 chemotaxis response regulator protein-glutamate methylesterase [Pantoea formicae]
MKRIRVMAVDDSALMRNMLNAIVNQQADMEMVATAPDPLIARDLIKQLNPDVLTLDIDMPRMDGLDFLSRLMRLRPMPVIMISSMTTRGSSATLNALEHGAVDFIPKPGNQIPGDLAVWGALLADKIRGAAKANPNRYLNSATVGAVLPGIKTDITQVIAIGASTGGTEALRCVLTQMPVSSPGIVIAQHMPAGFTRSFAQRMDTLCQIAVREAEHGEPLMPGNALIAPGDRHMTLVRRSRGYEVHIDENAPVNRHRPSVDVLFDSVAQQAGKFASAAILTGMGNDGARGLLTLRQAGAWTMAQNEASCVVFGMPREAIALDAACEVVDLDVVSQRLLDSFNNNLQRKRAD